MQNLRRHGKFFYLITLVIVSCSFLPLFAGEISSELTRNVISTGESAVFKIMISGDTSKIKPVKLPAIDGLKISYTGSSKSFQFVNGNVWSGIILNFTIYAEKSGVYKISPFVIEAGGKELTTKEETLTVREGGVQERRRGVTAFIRGEVELSSSEVRAGEPVIMRYYIYFSGNTGMRIEGFREQPNIKGFILTDMDEQIPPAFEVTGGVEYEKIHAGTFLLTPAGPGDYNAGGGVLLITTESGSGFFSFPEQKQVKMPHRQIKVMPLPVKGAPADFRGALGAFTMDSSFDKFEAKVSEEVSFTINVNGRGNFLSLHQPLVKGMEGARVLITDDAPVFYLSGNEAEGSKQFFVTVVPEKEGDINGSFYIPYYDPYSGEYKTVETAVKDLFVKGGAVPDSDDIKISKNENSDSMDLNYIFISLAALSGIAGIGFLLIRDRRVYQRMNIENAKAENDNAVYVKADDAIEESFENLKSSMNSDNKEEFLRNAVKVIDSPLVQSKNINELALVKEKVDLCRYAGAPLLPDDMEYIFTTIQKELFPGRK